MQIFLVGLALFPTPTIGDSQFFELITSDPIEITEPIPPTTMDGAFTPNTRLTVVEYMSATYPKPEEIEFDGKGNIYTSLENGSIIRINIATKLEEKIVHTGGRPLGMRFDKNGLLYVADALIGLLSLNISTREMQILSTEAEGIPFKFADYLDISSEGIIYFSDASTRHTVWDYEADLLEGRPNGRLLTYDPKTKM